MSLKSIINSYRRWTSCSVLASKRDYFAFRDSAYFRCARRRKLGSPLTEFFETDGMPLNVLSILQAFADDHIHHSQCKCGIGPRIDLYNLMTLIESVIPIR